MAYEKLVIAVDCDDVLVPTAEVIVREYNALYGTTVKLEAFYDDSDNWQTSSQEEAVRRVDKILKAGRTDDISPTPEVVESIKQLVKRGHELHLVTGRQDYMEPATRRLLSNYFPDMFKTIEHTNYYAASDSAAIRRTKGEVCRAIGASVLIDDHIVHGNAVLDAGVSDVIIFGDYPWNRRQSLVDGMVRCASWSETLDEIDRIASHK